MKSALLAIILVFVVEFRAQAPTSIEGVVVQVGTNLPVGGARVSMGAAQTTTDPNGSFTFQNVQPGRYRLVASHIDYTPATYTERKGTGRIAEVTVGFGEAIKDIVLGLTPNGAISGYVHDRNGKAISGVTVEALKRAYQDGRRILVSVRSAQTNKFGEYSLLSLAPGPYIVRASLGGSGSAMTEPPLPVYFPNTNNASMASLIDLSPAVNFTGVDVTITDVRPVRVVGSVTNAATGDPAVGAAVTLVPRRGSVATGTLQRAIVSPTGTFEFRHMAPGSYDLVSTTGDPIYGPLGASASNDVLDVDIETASLALQPQLSMNGRVSIDNGQGPPVNATAQNVRVELRREPYTPELLVLLPTIGSDGTFTFSGITPGEYQLRSQYWADQGLREGGEIWFY